MAEARSKRSSGKHLCHKDNWILQLVDADMRPKINLLETVPEGGDWAERERHWISQHTNLTNVSDGGDGPSGYVMSEDHKNKLRGQIRSAETRRLLSEARKNHVGWHHSAETKKKIGDAQRGKQRPPMSDETRKKISAAGKGRPKPDGFGAKISESNRGRKTKENAKRKISRSLMKYEYPPDDELLRMAETMGWAEMSRQTGIPESSIRQRTNNIRERGW